MQEKEMRAAVHALLRRVVYPAAVGVGLTLGMGCGDSDKIQPIYSAPYDAAPDLVLNDSATDASTVVKYMAPMDSGVNLEGAVALYQAPMDDGAVVKYMAPMDSGQELDEAVMKYMAPLYS